MKSHNIKWTSGGAQSIFKKQDIPILDKTIDSSSTTLSLIGNLVPNYGEIQQENFLALLEHFASNTVPANPTVGQLWWNPTDVALYICVEKEKCIPLSNYIFHYESLPLAWISIYPLNGNVGGGGNGVFEAASLAEYNALATDINRIVGTPSVYGTNIDTAENQWGWGQTDLVPLYDSLTQLSPGFSSTIYPSKFSNEAWVILLSRMRKAMRQVGMDESITSHIGFRKDGKPVPPGNALANTYNSFPTPGTQPNYVAGWNNLPITQVKILYNNTLTQIATLKTTRFSLAPLSSQAQLLANKVRTDPWSTTKTHTVVLTFANKDSARAYFNAGGTFKFSWSLAPSVNNSFTALWQNFLTSISNLIFDYKGLRYNTSYVNVGVPTSRGFYDLSSTFTTIYEKSKDDNGSFVYALSDGGMQIEAKYIEGTDFQIVFNFNFRENLNPSETVAGITTSTVWGQKANNVNTNTPVLSFPTGVSSGTF